MPPGAPPRLLSLLFGAVFAMAAAAPAHALETGSQAPLLELPGASGETIKVPRSPGKVLYIDFWASWCTPCRQSFPWMNQMQEKYQAQGFQIIGINLDTQAAQAANFLAKTPARFTVAYDPKGSSARLYGIKGMPTSVLIGKDGKVIYQQIGTNGESREKIERMIQSTLGAQG